LPFIDAAPTRSHESNFTTSFTRVNKFLYLLLFGGNFGGNLVGVTKLLKGNDNPLKTSKYPIKQDVYDGLG